MLDLIISRVLKRFGYVRQDKVNIQMQSIVNKAIELNDENKLLIAEMKRKNEQMDKYLSEINSLQLQLVEANEQVAKTEKQMIKQKEMQKQTLRTFDAAYKRLCLNQSR